MRAAERLERVFPWGVESGVRSAVLVVGCGIGLMVVWRGAADRGVFSTQIGWLTAGIVVLMVSLYGHVSLVIRGRRAVGLRRAALLNDGLGDLVPWLSDLQVANLPVQGNTDESEVVVVTGSDWFHESTCPMTIGRDTSVLSRAEAVEHGLVRCGICCDRSATSGGSAEAGGGRSG